MVSYIAVLRQILKRAWPDYERRHPDTPGPCHSCAFNPSTDTWPGFEKTSLGLMEAVQKDQPFYCHEHLPHETQRGVVLRPDAPAPNALPRLGGDHRSPRDQARRVRRDQAPRPAAPQGAPIQKEGLYSSYPDHQDEAQPEQGHAPRPQGDPASLNL